MKKEKHTIDESIKKLETIAEEIQTQLSASEALYGFCGWLTTRDQQTIISASDPCGAIVPLVEQFCETNQLPKPRENWEKNLTHPKENT